MRALRRSCAPSFLEKGRSTAEEIRLLASHRRRLVEDTHFGIMDDLTCLRSPRRTAFRTTHAQTPVSSFTTPVTGRGCPASFMSGARETVREIVDGTGGFGRHRRLGLCDADLAGGPGPSSPGGSKTSVFGSLFLGDFCLILSRHRIPRADLEEWKDGQWKVAPCLDSTTVNTINVFFFCFFSAWAGLYKPVSNSRH